MKEDTRGVFRPSHATQLEECIHWLPKERKTPAMERGTDQHEETAKVLAGQKMYTKVEDNELRENLRWLAEELMDRKITITDTEIEVEIRDDVGDVLTWGHIDAEGKQVITDELVILDIKTGDKRDYSAQVAWYGLGRMDARRQKRCVVLVAYIDLHEIEEYDLDYNTAEARFSATRSAFLAKEAQPYHPNDYCGWCAIRGTCPAWLKSAENALQPVTDPQYSESHHLAMFFHGLKQDPEKLGQFMIDYLRLKKIVEEDHSLRTVILEHLQAGTEIEGWTVGQRRGATHVDSAEFVAKVMNMIPSNLLDQLINVSAPALVMQWDLLHPGVPLPIEVSEAPRIIYAMQTRPKGAGKAASLRRKRTILSEGEVKE